MITSEIFWVATVVLTVVAFAFIGMPLLKDNRKTMLWVVALVLPVFSAGLYLLVGTPDATSAVSQAPVANSTGSAARNSSSQKVGSVASMVDGLVARLEKNPGDANNWLLLARTYKFLNRLEEAATAYEKAAALGQYDAELAALTQGERAEPEPVTQIFGNVSLSSQAMDIVQPNDTVFIFAREANGAPTPLAVLRRQAAELPIDFLLNDSQAMSAGKKLSDVEEVVVTARISRSGTVSDALKGLEAKSNTIVLADNRHINLQIK